MQCTECRSELAEHCGAGRLFRSAGQSSGALKVSARALESSYRGSRGQQHFLIIVLVVVLVT